MVSFNLFTMVLQFISNENIHLGNKTDRTKDFNFWRNSVSPDLFKLFQKMILSEDLMSFSSECIYQQRDWDEDYLDKMEFTRAIHRTWDMKWFLDRSEKEKIFLAKAGYSIWVDILHILGEYYPIKLQGNSYLEEFERTKYKFLKEWKKLEQEGALPVLSIGLCINRKT
jgi:hypothetical protein